MEKEGKWERILWRRKQDIRKQLKRAERRKAKLFPNIEKN